MFWEAEMMCFQIFSVSYFADVDLLVWFRKGSSAAATCMIAWESHLRTSRYLVQCQALDLDATSPGYHQIISIDHRTTSELHTRNSILLIMPACQLVKIQLVTCGNHWVLEYRTIELSQNLMNKLIQSVSSLVATAFPTQTRRQTFPCRPRNIKHNVITNSHNT